MKREWIVVAGALAVLAGPACKKSPEGGGPAESPTAAPVKVEIREPLDSELIVDSLPLGRQVVKTRHSAFDMGSLSSLFDGNWDNLARTLPTKTAVIEIEFPKPQPMKSMRMKTGAMDVGLTVRLFVPGEAQPRVYTKELRNITTEPTLELDFKDLRGPVQKARIELKDLAGGDGHIHLREIAFQ